jgi:hypothetical protein
MLLYRDRDGDISPTESTPFSPKMETTTTLNLSQEQTICTMETIISFECICPYRDTKSCPHQDFVRDPEDLSNDPLASPDVVDGWYLRRLGEFQRNVRWEAAHTAVFCDTNENANAYRTSRALYRDCRRGHPVNEVAARSREGRLRSIEYWTRKRVTSNGSPDSRVGGARTQVFDLSDWVTEEFEDVPIDAGADGEAEDGFALVGQTIPVGNPDQEYWPMTNAQLARRLTAKTTRAAWSIYDIASGRDKPVAPDEPVPNDTTEIDEVSDWVLSN